MSSQSNPPIRVAHVTEAGAGGVRVHLGHIIPELTARGIAVDVLVSAGRSEPDLPVFLERLRRFGCRTSIVSMAHGLRPFQDLLARRRLCAQVAEWGVDVVHAHATKAGLLVRSFPEIMGRNIPVVYSPHTFCFEGFRGLRRFLAMRMERWLANKTALFIFVSEAERQTALRCLRLAEAKIRVAANGLPGDFAQGLMAREQARDLWQIPKDCLAVGVPGRLAYQKGQDWLLRALSRLDLNKAGMRVYFCGTGPQDSTLRRLGESLGLGPFISWLGHVPDLARRLRAFDLVLLPSRYEGLSYALLETLSSGVPAIVSDIPAHFPHETARGQLPAVPVDDAQALADAISALVADVDKRGQISAWGPVFVGRHFSLGAQVDELASCYAALTTRM